MSKFGELVDRIRQGDQEAAAQLVREYEPAVRRIIRLKTTDKRMAAAFDSMDICQSVLASFFVRAAAGQYELTDSKQLLNLLAKMAQNKLAMQVRRQRAQRRDVRRKVTIDVTEQDVPEEASTPSRQLAAKEILEQVQQRLTTEEQQLMDLRNEGLAWQEIGDRLEASPEALRKQLTRAIDRVARELNLSESLSSGE